MLKRDIHSFRFTSWSERKKERRRVKEWGVKSESVEAELEDKRDIIRWHN